RRCTCTRAARDAPFRREPSGQYTSVRLEPVRKPEWLRCGPAPGEGRGPLCHVTFVRLPRPPALVLASPTECPPAADNRVRLTALAVVAGLERGGRPPCLARVSGGGWRLRTAILRRSVARRACAEGAADAARNEQRDPDSVGRQLGAQQLGEAGRRVLGRS